MKQVLLRMYGLHGCRACDTLNSLIMSIVSEPPFDHIQYSKHIITNEFKADEFGILPKSFPTLVSFIDGKLVFGWEGLATGLSDADRLEQIREELSKLLIQKTSHVSFTGKHS